MTKQFIELDLNLASAYCKAILPFANFLCQYKSAFHLFLGHSRPPTR